MWIVKAKIRAFNRLSPKNAGSFMRVSTLCEISTKFGLYIQSVYFICYTENQRVISYQGGNDRIWIVNQLGSRHSYNG